jgi:hypothetical protein
MKHSKFDVLIYDKDYDVLCIVEVKSLKRPNSKPRKNTTQLRKYMTFKKPIYLIWNTAMVSDFMIYLKATYPKCTEIAPKFIPAKELSKFDFNRYNAI